jgi:hypothetical protein
VEWAGNFTAEYAVDHWEELAGVSVSERLTTLKRSRYSERDAAARRGSEVHALAQRLARGEEVAVPEAIVGHVDAYLRFTEEWQPREVLVEAVVGKREPRYCGTLDLVADLADGRRWLLDWKTTRSGVYPENALQLAAYRYADFYVDADFMEAAMPEVDACGVVWLRADGYDLHPVEAGPAQFRVFQMVAHVARYADRDIAERLGIAAEVVHPPLAPPELEEVAE